MTILSILIHEFSYVCPLWYHNWYWHCIGIWIYHCDRDLGWLENGIFITIWCHQVEKFSALLALFEGVPRSPVNSPHKGQWRRALMYPLICAWTNDWVNTRDPDDLRRHGVHYDVTVMDPCGLLTSYSELKYRSIYGLPVSCRYEYNTSSWNTSSWKTSTDMSYKANIVADNG